MKFTEYTVLDCAKIENLFGEEPKGDITLKIKFTSNIPIRKFNKIRTEINKPKDFREKFFIKNKGEGFSEIQITSYDYAPEFSKVCIEAYLKIMI